MKKRKTPFIDDYLKANRKGSREAELEMSVGWTAKSRPHKNLRKYDRKKEKQNRNKEIPTFASLF